MSTVDYKEKAMIYQEEIQRNINILSEQRSQLHVIKSEIDYKKNELSQLIGASIRELSVEIVELESSIDSKKSLIISLDKEIGIKNNLLQEDVAAIKKEAREEISRLRIMESNLLLKEKEINIRDKHLKEKEEKQEQELTNLERSKYVFSQRELAFAEDKVQHNKYLLESNSKILSKNEELNSREKIVLERESEVDLMMTKSNVESKRCDAILEGAKRKEEKTSLEKEENQKRKDKLDSIHIKIMADMRNLNIKEIRLRSFETELNERENNIKVLEQKLVDNQ